MFLVSSCSCLPNPLKASVKSRLIYLEQRRQAMLQLLLSDPNFNGRLTKVRLVLDVWGNWHGKFQLKTPFIYTNCENRLIRKSYDNRDNRGIQFQVIQNYMSNCQVRPPLILVIQCILKEWHKNIYLQITKHVIDCIMDSNRTCVWFII